MLRTTTNPKLPLTQLEYDEFGHPAARPQEFYALQKISPVDAVKPTPNPPVFFIKTALHDVQVLPYEALKFAKKLREAAYTAVVAIDEDGGHFAGESALATQQAQDAAFIDSHVKKNNKSYTRRRSCHSSRGTRRRARSP